MTEAQGTRLLAGMRNWLHWHWLALAAVLATCLVCAVPMQEHGLGFFTWDDSEYLTNALHFYDELTERGLFYWPMQFTHQYGKPPLYVNTLIASLYAFGRDHLVTAAATVAVLNAMLLAWAVWRFMQPLVGVGFAVLSSLAVLVMPSVARWAPAAYPDIQLVAVVVLTLALLLSAERGLSGRQTLALGACFGLGVLAKATYPSFLGFPILYFLWNGWRDGCFLQRLRRLLLAGMLGILIAATWYYRNLGAAISYVRFAYDFNMGQVDPFLVRLQKWVWFNGYQGLGYFLLALAMLGLLGWLIASPGPRAELRERWRIYLYLALGALPAWFVALSSPYAPNNRHLLASYVLVALATLLFCADALRVSRLRPFVLGSLMTLLVLGQTLAVRLPDLPAIRKALMASGRTHQVAGIAPNIYELAGSSLAPAEDIMAMATIHRDQLPPNWYLAGDDAFCNYLRLNLLAAVQRLPQHFEPAIYFQWDEQRIAENFAKIKSTPSVVVVYDRPVAQQSELYKILNVESQRRDLDAFLHDPANGFTPLTATRAPSDWYTLQFYTAVWPTLASTDLIPQQANFSNQVMVVGAAIRNRKLYLHLRVTAPITQRYKLLLHAVPLDQLDKQEIWDQTITPPLARWPINSERLITYLLPPAYAAKPYRLRVGFFDENAAAKQWPPLKLTDGRPYLIFSPGELGE